MTEEEKVTRRLASKRKYRLKISTLLKESPNSEKAIAIRKKNRERRIKNTQILNAKRRAKRPTSDRLLYLRARRLWTREQKDDFDKERRGKWFRTHGKRLYLKKKRNPSAVIAVRFRIRLNKMMKRAGAVRLSTSQSLLGCSFDDFRNHLQLRFSPGMSWNNYGLWHIDHIKPCASFDLTKTEDQIACFHYSNMQPLWARDNRRKGDSETGDGVWRKKRARSLAKQFIRLV